MKKIAIVGATGNVGRIVTQKLKNKAELVLLASRDYPEEGVYKATPDRFKGMDICIFNTEADISESLIPAALEAGAYVVDSSSHYRLDPEVPLIVGPVNAHLVSKDQKLYAHANCLASPISIALASLVPYGIESVYVSTYQSTSGAGKKAMDECIAETESVLAHKSYQREIFKRQIAFNVIPQVSDIQEDGWTKEEHKIIHETHKILGQEFPIVATAVRVPVVIGHSISLSVRLRQQVSFEVYNDYPGVVFLDKDYKTPVEIEGSDMVFIGRARSNEMGMHMWLCSDNLHRGAATDAVEIVEKILSFETFA
jgi:aspartate-semialdehyde dehydrogenase